jgi:D-alanyl-lipoteichoic acid acyltransferase DltB (MBOAT superfamily)
VHLLPQVERARVIRPTEVVDGIWLIILGYLKKVIIADRLAEFVNVGFAGSSLPSDGIGNWLYLYAFAFQVYGDFAGYSDIARGLSKVMGFDLMVNFRAPYLAGNPVEFWQGWHISLSTWLRDYLYIPLGGNRWGSWLTYRNLTLTMLLGGLWHGAGWAYLLWGAYQGLLLVLHRALSPYVHRRFPTDRLPRPARAIARGLGIVAFFHLTCIGWLLFRAGSLPAGVDQLGFVAESLRTLVSPGAIEVSAQFGRTVLFAGGICLLLQWCDDAMNRFHRWSTWPQALAASAACLAICAFGVIDGAQFIYFQF